MNIEKIINESSEIMHKSDSERRTFDPDNRIDVSENARKIKDNSDKFDPDKRIIISTILEERAEKPYDSRGIEQPQVKSSSEINENNTNDSSDNKESNEYESTYDERIKQTPRKDSDRGEWEEERGESKFVPNDPEIKEQLEKYGLDGIEYKDGIPDFSYVSESTVEIDNMTENRAENFKQCDEKCAEQWNKEARDGRTDWTARDVAQWRKENGYSWHERNDMKTCDLIPTRVNDYFGHLGGVSECKKRDVSNDGGDFDE